MTLDERAWALCWRTAKIASNWKHIEEFSPSCPRCREYRAALVAAVEEEGASQRAEIERLREALVRIAVADDGQAHSEGCEHWDWGNYDDVYVHGVITGELSKARIARAALEGLAAVDRQTTALFGPCNCPLIGIAAVEPCPTHGPERNFGSAQGSAPKEEAP